MRMRPKKNREARMEKVCHLFAKTDENGRVDIISTFGESESGKEKELFLEIGCGKGSFAVGLSAKYPDERILAVELVSDVLMMAMEKAENEGCVNIAFIQENAERTDIFMPPGSVDRLYLNFSDPWPRKKNAKRRLTSPLFLERYNRILKSGGRIYFKTDNIGLFEYSLDTFREAGYTLANV